MSMNTMLKYTHSCMSGELSATMRSAWREVAADILGRGGELLRLIVLAREALDDAHCAHVLLDRTR